MRYGSNEYIAYLTLALAAAVAITATPAQTGAPAGASYQTSRWPRVSLGPEAVAMADAIANHPEVLWAP